MSKIAYLGINRNTRPPQKIFAQFFYATILSRGKETIHPKTRNGKISHLNL